MEEAPLLLLADEVRQAELLLQVLLGPS